MYVFMDKTVNEAHTFQLMMKILDLLNVFVLMN